jgi:hypothetical protein
VAGNRNILVSGCAVVRATSGGVSLKPKIVAFLRDPLSVRRLRDCNVLVLARG